MDWIPLGPWVRHGSPTRLQPNPETKQVALHDSVNVDRSSPGRLRGRPAARALYEKGSAEAANWPRMLATTT